MIVIPLQYQGLHLFRPPYRECTVIDPDAHPGDPGPGEAAVWFMGPGRRVHDELRWCALRPRSMPRFIGLPAPADVPDLAEVLRLLPGLRPRGVLPGVGRGVIPALRSLLSAPPAALPRAVADHLEVLYDIDVGAREQAESAGLRLSRIGSLNADPRLIDGVLDRQTVAIPTGNIRRIKASQRPRLDHDVLENLVQRRADVHIAVGERRPVVQDKPCSLTARGLDALVNPARLPLFETFRFARHQVGFHCKAGLRQVQRVLVVHSHD